MSGTPEPTRDVPRTGTRAAARDGTGAAPDVLTAADVTVAYAATRAVRGVSLTIGARSLVGVAGANGAGKSSLVGALAGWSRGRPRLTGRVALDGVDISGLPAERRARHGLALVPEGKGVFDRLTVEQNLRLVRPPEEIPSGARAYSVNDVYELFPQLRRRRDHTCSALSGGERQMAALGRALRAAPRVLILDEPSVGLAPRLVGELLRHLRDLADDGLSVLLVEQNVRAALEVVDRLHLLERGLIVASGTAERMRDDERIRAAYLGGLRG